MELVTSRFGELTIAEEDIYSFPKGIPGFEDHHGFVILAPEQDEPFEFLQSVTEGSLLFVIADPFVFCPDYDIEIPESALEELRIAAPEQILLRCIISIPGNLENATINLVAPIVINGEARLGRQVVLGKSPYTTKHSLFAAAEKG